jgi:hypothetical protein
MICIIMEHWRKNFKYQHVNYAQGALHVIADSLFQIMIRCSKYTHAKTHAWLTHEYHVL